MSLVSADWLREHLEDPTIRVLDVRWHLADADQGRREYLEGHIPGAAFLDLETDLSDLSKEGLGRHPAPDPATLAARFESAGIGDGDTVVAYDSGPGAIAARAWWLLRHLGHKEVAVLDGGIEAWRTLGGPETTQTPAHPRGSLSVVVRTDDTVSIAAVEAGGFDVLLDARDAARYRGEVEPVDPVPGHIPGATNLPFMELVEDDQRFMEPAMLRARFTGLGIGPDAAVVASCGSGVTACHLVLAAVVAGLPEPKLYEGSYSQWSRAGKPVET